MVPVALLLAAAPGFALASAAAQRPPAAGVVEADAGWRQDGNGPGRSGFQPVTPYLGTGSAARLDTVWTAPVSRPDELVGGAVVADGVLLRSSGGPTGQIRRYDAVTGADLGPVTDVADRRFGQLAVTTAGSDTSGDTGSDTGSKTGSDTGVGTGVGVGSGTGSAGAGGGTALLVEAQTIDPTTKHLLERRLTSYTMRGGTRWEAPLSDEVSGGFTVAGDLVLRAAGATLTALRVADGTTAWTAPLDGEAGLHPPVADAGVAIQSFEVGGGTGLAGFDLRTGARVWRQDASGPRVIAAGGVAYTTGRGGVCALTVADGARRWCDPETLVDPQFAATDGRTLMVLAAHGRAAGFDAADGTVRWTRDWGMAGAEVATSYWSPVTGGGVLYAVVYQFAIRDGEPVHRTELLALDAAAGTVLLRRALPFDALHGDEPLLLSGDHVYFAALEKLFALGVR